MFLFIYFCSQILLRNIKSEISPFLGKLENLDLEIVFVMAQFIYLFILRWIKMKNIFMSIHKLETLLFVEFLNFLENIR